MNIMLKSSAAVNVAPLFEKIEMIRKMADKNKLTMQLPAKLPEINPEKLLISEISPMQNISTIRRTKVEMM